MIVRKLEALFTINTNAVQFKKAAAELDGLASKAENVMKAIAGYWAVQALQNLVTNTASAMAEVGKTASHLGIATDALQELRYAADKSGISIDSLDDALKELQVRAVDATGKGEAKDAFEMLGLKSTDDKKRIREPLELLDAVADRLKALPDNSKRLWIADAIFGDEGAMILKMLKDGSLGLRQMRAEARALGVTLSSDSIAKASRFNQALNKLKNVSGGIGRTFVEKLLPPLTWLLERCSALSAALNKVESRSSLMRVTLLSLGSILSVIAIKSAIAFAPLLLSIGGVLLAIAAVALIVDDLWVAFKGGDSVFARLYKKARAFIEPIGQWLVELPRRFFTWLTESASNGLSFLKRKIVELQQWFFAGLYTLKEQWLSIFASLPGIVSEAISSALTFFEEKFLSFKTWLEDTMNALRSRISDFFLNLPGSIEQGIADGVAFVKKQFEAFQNWILAAADALKERFANLFDGIVPDFIKNGFAATINHVTSPVAEPATQYLNAQLAPTPASVLNQNRVSTNQSVNVAVNVASGSNPQDIGGEVAKAVRKELERERFNAFMGVTQYAG